MGSISSINGIKVNFVIFHQIEVYSWDHWDQTVRRIPIIMSTTLKKKPRVSVLWRQSEWQFWVNLFWFVLTIVTQFQFFGQFVLVRSIVPQLSRYIPSSSQFYSLNKRIIWKVASPHKKTTLNRMKSWNRLSIDSIKKTLDFSRYISED